MKRALVVALPLILGGCGATTIAGVAFYTLEGATMAASGRTLSDHIISAMMEQDCAVFRVIKDQVVCREFREGDETFLVALVKSWKQDVSGVIAVAELALEESDPPASDTQESSAAAAIAVQPAAGAQGAGDNSVVVEQLAMNDPVIVPPAMSDIVPGLEGAVAVEPAAGPSGTASFAPPSDNQMAAVVDTAPVPAPTRMPDTLEQEKADSGWKPVISGSGQGNEFLVLGSFTSRRNALQEASTWPSFKPKVVSAQINGRTWYRVVAGPFGSELIERRRSQAWSRGIRDVWSTKLCPAGTSGSRCISMPAG